MGKKRMQRLFFELFLGRGRCCQFRGGEENTQIMKTYKIRDVIYLNDCRKYFSLSVCKSYNCLIQCKYRIN